MTDQLANLDAERSILGACLMNAEFIDVLAGDLNFRDSHFHGREHGWIFAAMVTLRDQDREVDSVTICQEANDHGHQLDRHAVDLLSLHPPVAGNFREYARIVLDLATWRHRLAATGRMQAAIVERDQAAFDQAEALIAVGDRPDDSTSTPEELASDAFDWLASTDPDGWPTPFPTLTSLLYGGFRRGQTTFITGNSYFGKSLVLDRILEHLAQLPLGLRVHLYINEETRLDRYLKRLCRHSSVTSHRNWRRERLNDRERAELTRAMGAAANVTITDCAGWTETDICRHVRRHRPDVCAVDLLQLIPHSGAANGRTQQVDAISAALNAAAKQTGAHLFLVGQLGKPMKGFRPRPTPGDIRDSGQLYADAANVIMVHREQEQIEPGSDSWRVLPEGLLLVEKAKTGSKGVVAVTLNEAHYRFDEPPTMALATAGERSAW